MSYNIYVLFAVLWVGIHILPTKGLTGYDCSHPNLTITTLSGRHVPACNNPSENVTMTQEVIQLIQLADSYPIMVYQCKIQIMRAIYYCGMSSHSSIVEGGLADYLMEISGADCKKAHSERRVIVPGGVVLNQLVINKSQTRPLVFAGTLDRSGNCERSSYSDSFGSWKGVTVSGTVKITLTSYEATVDTTTGKVKLRSGVSCRFDESECVDVENGYTTWEYLPMSACDERKHLVLYEGPAERVGKAINSNYGHTYIVDHGPKVFGLTTTGIYSGCFLTMYTTEHPKLVIATEIGGKFIFRRQEIPTSSMDLMTYLNAKFVFIDKQIDKSISLVYKELSAQRCAIERRTLLNLLSLAYVDPKEFAYTYTEKPGYTARVIGEVIHLIKCSPVEVKMRKTLECFNEIPITWRNQSYFLTPKTRLIQARGTQVDCDGIINPQYLLEGQWYGLTGGTIHEIPNPQELTVTPVKTWKSKSISNLAEAGIYDYNEAEKMRERIMNPYERDAISNIITRGAQGVPTNMQGISLANAFDPTAITDLGNKLGARIWGWFSVFGNMSAGIIGLFAIGKLIKFIVDTIIHGTVLYELYGFGVALLGSLWDSVTYYLVHNKYKKNAEQGTNSKTRRDEEQELQTIMIPEGHREYPTAPETQSPYSPAVDQLRTMPVLPRN